MQPDYNYGATPLRLPLTTTCATAAANGRTGLVTYRI